MRYLLNFEINKLVENIDIEQIKKANEIELKIILLVLKKSILNVETKFMVNFLKISVSDFEKAMKFWVDLNIFNIDNRIYKRNEFMYNNFVNKDFLKNNIENFEFKDFFFEIEQIVGRTISISEINIILNLNIYEKIPKEVILMLVQWCIQNGKNSFRYIEKVGIDWASQGIFSVKDLEDKIKEFENNTSIWTKCRKIFGIEERAPSKKEEESCRRWIQDWGFTEELIKEAYEICINFKGKFIFSYINKILESWKDHGVDTLQKLEILKKNEKSKDKINKNKKNNDISSYDIEIYEKFKLN